MATAREVLTPDALSMLQTVASTGSFAAAARQLGLVPSALSYRVRQHAELGQRLRSHRRMHCHHDWHEIHLAHRRKLLQRVGKRGAHRRVDDETWKDHEQRVAVGRGARNGFGRKIGVPAGSVLDQHRRPVGRARRL